MITLDTSGLIAMLDRRDAAHARVADALRAAKTVLVVPVPVIAEMTYMVEARLGARAVQAFTTKLAEGAFHLDCCEGDYADATALMARYDYLPLPFTDAAVATCAVRNGGALLTTDRRDFDVVARGGLGLELLP